MLSAIDKLVAKLAMLVSEGRHEPVETDTLELKPVPADGGSWRECHKTVNAFLNTRGGMLLLGLREESVAGCLVYRFTGYRAEAEEKLKELPGLFTDKAGKKLLLGEAFPPVQLRPFLDGQVALVLVDELPADQKYVFYRGEAFKRVLTGDHRLTEAEISLQEEYRQESWQARELVPIAGTTPDNFDLDALNDYIQQLNRPARVETIKADLVSARPFLERKRFVVADQMTTLGMLVCGRNPQDYLGFRCHVHGYVEMAQQVVQDKQDFIGTILPLMEHSLNYILRNIQVGIVAAEGGTAAPQYPEEVLRETVNNALAHRDYAIEKQAIISIKPGVHIAIRNPGAFRPHLLLEYPDDTIPLRRIIPEAKPRNPKLADVLRVYRKWEGKGIGMATLVNLCLANKLDLPTYRLYGEEVCLFLNAGQLYDERMKTRLASYDAFLEKKLGASMTLEQALVLSYLMKSEWANQRYHYSILLTPDNNHFTQLLALERAGLIQRHPRSTATYPIYVPDRALMQDDFRAELTQLFGTALPALDRLAQQCLNEAYRHGCFAKANAISAKKAAYALWYAERGTQQDIRAFDAFYRRVRRAFNKLLEGGFVVPAGRGGYLLNERFASTHLL